MDFRLRGLENLDPRAVPLPHGTEVITRIDRAVGDRRVLQGSVGRVVKIDGESLDVAIVGVGTIRYARSELVPRRIGQVVFARRREAAWHALAGCAVLEATVGSRAWGLSSETSDTDRRGVFALPLSWTLGLVLPPEDLVSADGSVVCWSAGKCVRQALRADPNTLEMLFVPGARALDPIGEWLLAERDAFVSAEIHGTFGRYAIAQLHRLEQGTRLAELRGVVLDWLRDDPSLTLDAVAERLADASPRAAPTRADAVLEAKQRVKQLYRSLADQGLLPASDFPSLVLFATERAAELELPRELRPKNAYNLLRLIWTATEWLRSGEPVFAPTAVLRERLFAIKRGEVQISDVLKDAEGMIPDLDAARASTRLPGRGDVRRADALLRRIGEEVARRFVEQAAGIWGRDAPPPPAAEWAE